LQNRTQETHCNLCSADDNELLWTARDLAFGGTEEFPLVRCRRCGLIYLRTRPTPAEMGHYYPPEYHGMYRQAIQDESFFLMRWMRRYKVRKRRSIIERASSHVPGRILDVGCSTGIFLDEMQQSSWETYGVETSVHAAQYARRRFGLEVFEGQLDEAGLPSGHFDAVTLWDVLEHTFDPLSTLREVNRLLVNGGIVGMTLPNWHSLDRMLFGDAWIGYDVPRHLYVFTQPVLRRLLKDAGFCVVRAFCGLGGYFTFRASVRLWLNKSVRSPKLRQAVETLMDLPGVRLPFEPFFYLGDRLGYGGTLVVVGRKTETM
jgi:SAM-dependent methyltransferase